MQCFYSLIHVLQVSSFDLKDLVVDIGYWFKGSTNRKGYLTGMHLIVPNYNIKIQSIRIHTIYNRMSIGEFGELHETEYMEILIHVSVRSLVQP